jgi:predicted Zn-dependent protease
MKRFDLVFATALVGLAAFVGSEAVETRQALASRTGRGETVVTNEAPAVAALPPAPEEERDDRVPNAEDVKRRLELSAASTYIGEVLAAHDSSLARWADREANPLRIWIQPTATVTNWKPAFAPLVREAFMDWGETGVPLNFAFVSDSSSADVHVTWIDRFNESISGKTLWTHDERWLILAANVVLAVHHRSGDPLDAAAMKAIALHEVGHLLGLDHTVDSTSIMAPRVRVKSLSAADRATAQVLYSLPPGRVGKTKKARRSK